MYSCYLEVYKPAVETAAVRLTTTGANALFCNPSASWMACYAGTQHVPGQKRRTRARHRCPQRRCPGITKSYLGMDEISLRKGHKGYATILTDLTDPSKPEILAMATGRDEAAGKTCLEVLTSEQREAVQFHHTDMGTAFLAACRQGLKNSKSVIDRFHVAKKLGEVADALRKKTTEPTSAVYPVRNGSACVP